MTYNVKFKRLLPTVNLSDQFIIDESAYTTLGEDWLSYAQYIIKLAHKENTKFKTIRDATKKNRSILSLSDKAKNLLGIGPDFCVVDIFIDKDNNIKVTPLMGYEELINIYFSKEKQKVHGSVIKAIVDRFFGYQWGKKKLLYPINKIPNGYQRPDNWNEMVQESKLAQMLTIWYKQKIKSKTSSKQALYQRRQALNRVLSSTQWHLPEQVLENELSLMRQAMREGAEDSNGDLGRTITTLKPDIIILNDLRFMLIDQGREDIKKPREIVREKRSSKFGDGSEEHDRFAWVDTNQYPTLAKPKENAYTYIQRLKVEGLSRGTINSRATALNNFFRFLIDMCPYDEVTVELIDELFDPNSKRNLYAYLEQKRGSRESASDELNKMITFFVHCEIYSAKARKYTPIIKKKTKREPYRDAMPKEMVAHIIDILKNRPPSSTTQWERKKADSTWWKHDVYPVYPIMMLLGYYIPLRGEQIRWLCRDNSFVFDDYGKIERLIINTDKNVNRKYLQEIPCVWDDLQILVPFLKWHKKYFPHLTKIKYNNDENSPWEDIIPLMITPQVLRPMSKRTHMDYHKRVLCQYQIEVMQQAREEGHNNYPIVAQRTDGKPFFESVDDLNKATNTDMKNIKVSYDIHSLRVTGATRYLEAGVGIKTVMDLTGHASAETLIRVYVNLTREEKEMSLRSASAKIFFGEKEDLVQNINGLIKEEFVNAYNKSEKDIVQSFNDNKLFSLYRKASATKTSKELFLGTDIAKEKHPTTWRPMIQGICPGVKCPEGRENKCSLCPYLITGKLFINGIVHQLNSLFAAFQREALIIEEEHAKGYDNHARIEEQETRLEEILGYQNILDKIDNDIAKEEQSNGKEVTSQKHKSSVAIEALPPIQGYLKNAYDAEMIGVEKDHYGMKILTIRAIKVVNEMNNKKALDSILADESKAIDMLMNYYTSRSIEKDEDVGKLISSIGILPEKIEKSQ